MAAFGAGAPVDRTTGFGSPTTGAAVPVATPGDAVAGPGPTVDGTLLSLF